MNESEVVEHLPAIPEGSPIELDLSKGGLPIWGGFDLKTQEGMSIATHAMQGEHATLNDTLNNEIALINVATLPASKVDESTGEEHRFLGIVLYAEDGRSFFTGSSGIAKSLRMLIAQKGAPPWSPGVACTPKSRPLADGRHQYYLAFSAPNPVTAKRGKSNAKVGS